MEQTANEDCILCCEPCVIIGLGSCNHKPMCLNCIYKMRQLNESKNCPICQSVNHDIIMTSRLDTAFQDYDLAKLFPYDKKAGIYCASKEAVNQMKSLKVIKCFYPKCKNPDEEHPNMNSLKRHLKEAHNRYLCDYCLKNKKCLLHEHILYNKVQHKHHIEQGDLDEDGYPYFFHPYCEYCDTYTYDEESMKTHMTNHFQCHICQKDPNNKFLYYNNYASLEKHFRISHYICEEEHCLAQCFIVFKTMHEYDVHNITVHKVKTGQQALEAISGFDGNNKGYERDKGKIIDKEHKNFQMQFLSETKTKLQTAVVEQQQDRQFDFRYFYNTKYDVNFDISDQELLADCLENEGYSSSSQGKAKKTNKKNKETYLEDLRFIKYNSQNILDFRSFDQKMNEILNRDQMNDFRNYKNQYFKRQIDGDQFFNNFLDICGTEIGLKMFPIFIRTCKSNDMAMELDSIYLEEISQLPKKHTNLINTASTYIDFFGEFLRELEENITHRIESKRLPMKKRITMEKERIFQLIGVIRRLQGHEMSKLKFLTNFGISVEGIEYITNKVYFAKLDKIQEKIQKIPTQDLVIVYLYVQLSYDILSGKIGNISQKDISSLVLKEYFKKHPDIVDKFCKKYRTDISDNTSSDDEEDKKFKQFQKKQKKKKQQIEVGDGQFPDLSKETQKKIQQDLEEEQKREEKQIELELEIQRKKRLEEEEELTRQYMLEQERKRTEQIKLQNQKYSQAKKQKYNKDQYQDEQIEYKVDQGSNKVDVKERRVYLDSDDEKEKQRKKKEKKVDIQKQKIQHKKSSDDDEEDFPTFQEKIDKNKKQSSNLGKSTRTNEELLAFDGSDIEDIEDDYVTKQTQKSEQNWGGLSQQNNQQKIQYENSNAQQRLKSEFKQEEQFPTLGGRNDNKERLEDQIYKSSGPTKPKKNAKKIVSQIQEKEQEKLQEYKKPQKLYNKKQQNSVFNQQPVVIDDSDDNQDDIPYVESKTMQSQQEIQKNIQISQQKQKQFIEENTNTEIKEKEYPGLPQAQGSSLQDDIYKKKQKKQFQQQQKQQKQQYQEVITSDNWNDDINNSQQSQSTTSKKKMINSQQLDPNNPENFPGLGGGTTDYPSLSQQQQQKNQQINKQQQQRKQMHQASLGGTVKNSIQLQQQKLREKEEEELQKQQQKIEIKDPEVYEVYVKKKIDDNQDQGYGKKKGKKGYKKQY